MTAVELIPIEQIRILNPRARSRTKWKEIVGNIAHLGLKRPITVCRRGDGETGYDLVCGQGRLEAYTALGQKEIPALVVTAAPEDRYLMSLVENMARRHLSAVELVRQIATLKERGYTLAQIAAKVDLGETYVKGLLRLLDHGEDRLLRAVERGEIPIATAIEIAYADEASVQRSLTEAYERGELKGRALIHARKLVERRRVQARKGGDPAAPRQRKKELSTDELLRTYRKETARQKLLTKKAQICETRLVFVVGALRELVGDGAFLRLLRAEKLDKLPKYLAEQVRA